MASSLHGAVAAVDVPLILYLPGHPNLSKTQDLIPRALKTLPVARVNYRWSRDDRFPMPVHDTLFAWDWICEHLIDPLKESAGRSEQARPRRKIFVYGENLGGSLATALALTECRPKSSPADLAALAVENAIFDWPELALSAPLSSTPPEDIVGKIAIEEMSSATWLGLARNIFASPMQCFDPFASPHFFFRTAGRSIPKSWEEPDLEAELEPEVERLPTLTPLRSRQNDIGLVDETELADLDARMHDLPIPRRAHVKFPPRKSGLSIPYTRISVSEDDGPLVDQAAEIVKLLRRSVSKYLIEADEDFKRPGRVRLGRQDQREVEPSTDAESRIEFERAEGGERELEHVVSWFHEVAG